MVILVSIRKLKRAVSAQLPRRVHHLRTQRRRRKLRRHQTNVLSKRRKKNQMKE
uniref:Uncharacterized protein n=1 Tax=Arundo donax TaxID=35708 RepID=A0A0A9E5S8_ARUDO